MQRSDSGRQGQARDKGLLIKSALAPNLPSAVIADYGRLHQILINLLGNAVKFTAQGHVELTASYHDQTLHLEIADTGMGMTAEDLERIGQPFVQVGHDTTLHQQGSGLGLSIVFSLVELMGGHMSIASELGKGSQFRLTLPFPRATNDETRLTTEGTAAIRRDQSLTQYRILIVDDNKVNRSITAALLSKFDIDATVASSGREALNGK